MSLENCALEVVRSIKTWRKSRCYNYSETVRGKDVFPLLFWLCRPQQQFLLCMFAFWHFSTVQGITQRHRTGCITICCYHEGSGSLIWRANCSCFNVCIAWPLWRCAAPTNSSGSSCWILSWPDHVPPHVQVVWLARLLFCCVIGSSTCLLLRQVLFHSGML